MNAIDIFRLFAPSVANLIFERDSVRVSSGSGFIVSNKLVTADHVMIRAHDVSLRVVFEKAVAPQESEWRYDASAMPCCAQSRQRYHDFTALAVPEDFALPQGFEWADGFPEPGEAVCTLGYPFDHPNLTVHQGHISSVFQSGVATMLKLDMSINASNSGGPLVRLADGKVLGVITRKTTELTKAFDELQKAMDENIQMLSGPQSGTITHNGINPLQLTLAIQNQMRHVATEIKRSANVGIGYAVWNRPLRDEACFNT